MKVIIIEDEIPARAKLIQMLKRLQPDIMILAELGSVKETLQWLKTSPAPDLAFVDIQLSDNHSLQIFREHQVNFPVVFTTAYDKYLLQSFETSSIDYLLKPITEDKLRRALQKVDTLRSHFLKGQEFPRVDVPSTIESNRIIARRGTEYVVLDTAEVAYFYTEHKVVFLRDDSGRRLIVDETLGELEERLREQNFFRINRKYLASSRAVERFKPEQGKIRVHLKPPMDEEIHVSKETAPFFRKWIGPAS